MLLRFLLISVLLTLALRAITQLLEGIKQGMRGESASRSRVPQRGVQMARDPVCGTFVVPDRALSISVGRDRLYFCSAACRDKYRAKTA
jgi:hypothetical protein